MPTLHHSLPPAQSNSISRTPIQSHTSTSTPSPSSPQPCPPTSSPPATSTPPPPAPQSPPTPPSPRAWTTTAKCCSLDSTRTSKSSPPLYHPPASPRRLPASLPQPNPQPSFHAPPPCRAGIQGVFGTDCSPSRTQQTYISPSDTIMSPCTAKLSAYKSKHFLK